MSQPICSSNAGFLPFEDNPEGFQSILLNTEKIYYRFSSKETDIQSFFQKVLDIYEKLPENFLDQPEFDFEVLNSQ